MPKLQTLDLASTNVTAEGVRLVEGVGDGDVAFGPFDPVFFN